MNGYGDENFILADRRLMTVAAEKERNKALRAAKIASMR